MQQLIDVPDQPILRMLEQPCADLAAWLSPLNRQPEPARIPEPVRPDGPSRTHPPSTTASSNASGVEPAAPAGAAARIPAARPEDRARSPNDPAAWGDAARSPTTGKNLEDHPALATDTFAARPPFQRPDPRFAKFASSR